MSELGALRQRIRDTFAEPPPPPRGYATRLEFRYYLPAYLLRALDAIDAKAAARGRAEDVLEFTLYALRDTTNEMSLASAYANTRAFTDEERAVIRMFLETVGAWDEGARRYQDDVASALGRFG